MLKIILATNSPHRQEAFKFLGVDFQIEASNIDESVGDRTNPENLVSQLAKLKAEALGKNYPDSIIIGMDSVGYFNNQILEKPKSKEDAFQRLQSLSSNWFQFYTGIFMINTNTRQTLPRIVKTDVLMRKLSDLEINKYLNQDQNYNTYALGFDPLGNYSSTFISEIKGSYNNLTRGIPLEVLPEILSELGYKL